MMLVLNAASVNMSLTCSPSSALGVVNSLTTVSVVVSADVELDGSSCVDDEVVRGSVVDSSIVVVSVVGSWVVVRAVVRGGVVGVVVVLLAGVGRVASVVGFATIAPAGTNMQKTYK